MSRAVGHLMPKRRSVPLCRSGLAASMVFGFFFNLNLQVAPDRSGRMFIEFPANPLTSFDSEVARFGSSVSKVTGFRVRRGLAQVRVRFTDVNGLSEAPGLSNSIVKIEEQPGGPGRFQAVIRATAPGDKPVLDNTEMSTVRVSLPGRILESNDGTVTGQQITWRQPARDYLTRDGIRLDATYQRPPAPASTASTGAEGPG